jgi:hypothetical protein
LRLSSIRDIGKQKFGERIVKADAKMISFIAASRKVGFQYYPEALVREELP